MTEFCGDDAKLYKAALNACSPSPLRRKFGAEVINWRIFGVAEIKKPTPGPASELVRHAVTLLAAQFLRENKVELRELTWGV